MSLAGRGWRSRIKSGTRCALVDPSCRLEPGAKVLGAWIAHLQREDISVGEKKHLLILVGAGIRGGGITRDHGRYVACGVSVKQRSVERVVHWAS